MKKIVFGFIIGALISISATAYADEVKQYILKLADYPIFVNGTQYADTELPILNYQGYTYVPLSKLGDLTGVDYEWNDELKRVEINTDVGKQTAAETSGQPGSASELFAVEAGGAYAGYMMLKGYPNEDKYRIYFKGNADSYMTTIEDLRGINLNETIAWQYGGQTYRHARKDLYVFFLDTTWFRNNLNGVTDYTLTHEWFVDTFGDVYLEWADGIGYSAEAARLVNRYFNPEPIAHRGATLLPDTVIETVDEPEMVAPTIEEVMEAAERTARQYFTEEEWAFMQEWVGEKELRESKGISIVRVDSIKFYRYTDGAGMEQIFEIPNVPRVLDDDTVYEGSGIRYMSGFELVFNRADLQQAGILE